MCINNFKASIIRTYTPLVTKHRWFSYYGKHFTTNLDYLGRNYERDRSMTYLSSKLQLLVYTHYIKAFL